MLYYCRLCIRIGEHGRLQPCALATLRARLTLFGSEGLQYRHRELSLNGPACGSLDTGAISEIGTLRGHRIAVE